MKETEFETVHPPATEDEIQRLEQEFQFQMPEDMRQFYLRQNGGCLPHESRIDPEGCRLRHFLSIGPAELDHLSTIHELLKWQKIDGLIPMEYIPFCEDEATDFYYICVSAERYGKVYYLFSEFLDDFLEDPEENGFVADSFTDFLEKIDISSVS